MSLCELLRKIIDASGRSHRDLAASMGKSDAYVSVAVSNVCNGRDIGVSRFVSIADACGYDVEVVSRDTGERIRLGDLAV